MGAGNDLQTYPRMVRWFAPVLLAKLLFRVIVADVFGQYADRRLVHAALDTVDDNELTQRADVRSDVRSDPDGALWVDYVSDLGDGFDATYAVAWLLAQDKLRIGETDLPRGSLLILGGDQVYPTATWRNYRERMRMPYSLAFPRDAAMAPTPMFLVPGNHDWYDGLVQFLALFSRKKSTRIGNWETRQRRSYFALRLATDWWLWGIDIALTADMDQPQADYFVAIANAMPENAKLIICTAEPGWYKAKTMAGSFRSLGYAAWIAENARKRIKIVAVLSGDSHHYARYSSEFETQFITAGGGGAFLHGTLDLKATIDLRSMYNTAWLGHGDSTLSLTTKPDADHEKSTIEACYPSKDESRKLLCGNLRFPLLNWDFAVLLGTFYWLMGFALSVRPRVDTAVIVFLTLIAGFVGYTGYQEKWSVKAIVAAALHGIAHFAGLVLLTWAFYQLNVRLIGAEPATWAWFFALLVEMVPGGGALAGFIFGVYLLISCGFFDLSHNDAFSAMRLDSHRHFLRLRIKGEELTIYPIAVDRVPRRHEWQENPDRKAGPVRGVFIPKVALPTKLIEGPVVVDAGKVPPVTARVAPTDVSSPEAVPPRSPSTPT